MADKVKRPWMRMLLIASAGLAAVWISGTLQNCGNHSAAIEALYQEVQAIHQGKLVERLLSIKRQEAIQAVTAATYQVKLDQLAAAADAKVKALKWKSNEQLTKEKATAEEIKSEKKKVEDALVVMTQDRDDLKSAAEAREKEIAVERVQLKTEYDAALKKKQDMLDTCEKARTSAGDHPTWLSIGPGITVFIQGGEVRHAYGLSVQIPIIQIKSPFKRF